MSFAFFSGGMAYLHSVNKAGLEWLRELYNWLCDGSNSNWLNSCTIYSVIKDYLRGTIGISETIEFT